MQLDDPRTLLRCSPQELLGEWTPEKWDYWLQTARETEILAQDELALGSSRHDSRAYVMVRQLFITSVDSRHLQTTFQQLAAKLQQQFHPIRD